MFHPSTVGSAVVNSFLLSLWLSLLCRGLKFSGLFPSGSMIGCPQIQVACLVLPLLVSRGDKGCVRRCGGARIISVLPNLDLLECGMASFLSWGMQALKLFQLNLVDLQIMGATKLLLSTDADAVLPWIEVGAACIKAASTVTRVL